jgi:tRNA (guanosine-2'-O-)-methyltransferase
VFDRALTLVREALGAGESRAAAVDGGGHATGVRRQATANLGTLLRTCDAVGACLAVPRLPGVPEALARGNTLRHPVCMHGVGDPLRWLESERAAGSRILGVELADEAIRLADLPAARGCTVAVLGHEQHGIPPEALDLLDAVVEIPMMGTGLSLNVAVAGSLVLYRLAGLL